MKKRKLLKEKMGGGQRIGLGGINSTGPHYDRYNFKHPSGYHTGGYQGNPDSQFSQRLSLSSTLEEEKEEKENTEQTEDKEMSQKETLYEFFARIARLPLNESKNVKEGGCSIDEGHCSTHESSCTMSEMHCDEALRIMEEQELEEMSTVASLGGGPATPLGTDAKGKVPSSSKRKSRMNHAKTTFGGK